jgi:hypothetical protein
LKILPWALRNFSFAFGRKPIGNSNVKAGETSGEGYSPQAVV